MRKVAPVAKEIQIKDGVNDAEDQCPQSSEIVDGQGCDLDADSDGVIDMWDDCANTPNGYSVDVVGCSLDVDQDGVNDAIDLCPDTIEGLPVVDSSGCAPYQLNDDTNTQLNSDNSMSPLFACFFLNRDNFWLGYSVETKKTVLM